MIDRLLVSFLCAVFFSSAVLAQLSVEQQVARDKGIAMYHQSMWTSAQPVLRVAAEAGDRSAQYFLGEAIRLSSRYTTEEARKWYEAAAEQGDLYAMLRLGSESDLCHLLGTCGSSSGKGWRERAIDAARERAAKGDTEAMTVLFTVGEGLGWLQQAAEAGDAGAQEFLATIYKDGGSWFLIPGSRERAVDKWYAASAKGGDPRGMHLYASYLYDTSGGIEKVAYWLKKSAESSHIESVSAYAIYMSEPHNRLGYPHNMVAAYGLTYLLTKLEGGGATPEYSREKLPEIAEKMTEDEIKKGIEFAKDWEKNHPPLSYYKPVYGY